MVDVAIIISVLLLIAIHYGLVRTSFEVFTYKKVGRLPVLVASTLSVVLSIELSYLLGFLILLAFLLLQHLSKEELLVVAFTVQFGFMMGMAVVMVFLMGIGFVLDIPSLQVNMTPEEVARFIRG